MRRRYKFSIGNFFADRREALGRRNAPEEEAASFFNEYSCRIIYRPCPRPISVTPKPVRYFFVLKRRLPYKVFNKVQRETRLHNAFIRVHGTLWVLRKPRWRRKKNVTKVGKLSLKFIRGLYTLISIRKQNMRVPKKIPHRIKMKQSRDKFGNTTVPNVESDNSEATTWKLRQKYL